jgi:hypothetical protein
VKIYEDFGISDMEAMLAAPTHTCLFILIRIYSLYKGNSE